MALLVFFNFLFGICSSIFIHFTVSNTLNRKKIVFSFFILFNIPFTHWNFIHGSILYASMHYMVKNELGIWSDAYTGRCRRVEDYNGHIKHWPVNSRFNRCMDTLDLVLYSVKVYQLWFYNGILPRSRTIPD